MLSIKKFKKSFKKKQTQNLHRNIPQISPDFPQTETPVQARHFHRSNSSNKAGSLTLCRSPVLADCVGNVHAFNIFFFTSSNKPHNLGEGDTTTHRNLSSSHQCSAISLSQAGCLVLLSVQTSPHLAVHLAVHKSACVLH